MAGRKFNADHLSSSNYYQVQMLNWYEIVIGGLSEDFTFLTQSCSIPESSNPAVEIPFGNSTAKVAGKREVGESNITFIDAVKADLEKQLVEWQNQVYDEETGKMGWVEDYKRDVYITQYGPDGTYERKWHVYGAWPTSINFGEFSGEGSDKKLIQVTLACDKCVRE